MDKDSTTPPTTTTLITNNNMADYEEEEEDDLMNDVEIITKKPEKLYFKYDESEQELFKFTFGSSKSVEDDDFIVESFKCDYMPNEIKDVGFFSSPPNYLWNAFLKTFTSYSGTLYLSLKHVCFKPDSSLITPKLISYKDLNYIEKNNRRLYFKTTTTSTTSASTSSAEDNSYSTNLNVETVFLFNNEQTLAQACRILDYLTTLNDAFTDILPLYSTLAKIKHPQKLDEYQKLSNHPFEFLLEYYPCSYSSTTNSPNSLPNSLVNMYITNLSIYLKFDSNSNLTLDLNLNLFGFEEISFREIESITRSSLLDRTIHITTCNTSYSILLLNSLHFTQSSCILNFLLNANSDDSNLNHHLDLKLNNNSKIYLRINEVEYLTRKVFSNSSSNMNLNNSLNVSNNVSNGIDIENERIYEQWFIDRFGFGRSSVFFAKRFFQAFLLSDFDSSHSNQSNLHHNINTLNNKRWITKNQYLKGMSILSRGTIHDQLTFAFHMICDINTNTSTTSIEYISRTQWIEYICNSILPIFAEFQISPFPLFFNSSSPSPSSSQNTDTTINDLTYLNNLNLNTSILNSTSINTSATTSSKGDKSYKEEYNIMETNIHTNIDYLFSLMNSQHTQSNNNIPNSEPVVHISEWISTVSHHLSILRFPFLHFSIPSTLSTPSQDLDKISKHIEKNSINYEKEIGLNIIDKEWPIISWIMTYFSNVSHSLDYTLRASPITTSPHHFEFRNTFTFSRPPFSLTQISPIAFEKILRSYFILRKKNFSKRNSFEISNNKNDFKMSYWISGVKVLGNLMAGNLETLKPIVSTARSSSQLYILSSDSSESSDLGSDSRNEEGNEGGRNFGNYFLLKSLPMSEFKFLAEYNNTSSYFNYLESNPHSFLVRIFALFKTSLTSSSSSASSSSSSSSSSSASSSDVNSSSALQIEEEERGWCIMQNLLGTELKVEQVYDLKGSEEGRKVDEEELMMMKGKVLKMQEFAQKDCNFIMKRKRIELGSIHKKKVLLQLKRDIEWMQSHNIFDYSLFIAICSDSDSSSTNSTEFGEEEEDDDEEEGWWRYKGGIKGRDENGKPKVFIIGLIDCFGTFEKYKWMEMKVKTSVMRKDKEKISVMEPELYRERFMKMLEKVFV